MDQQQYQYSRSCCLLTYTKRRISACQDAPYPPARQAVPGSVRRDAADADACLSDGRVTAGGRLAMLHAKVVTGWTSRQDAGVIHGHRAAPLHTPPAGFSAINRRASGGLSQSTDATHAVRLVSPRKPRAPRSAAVIFRRANLAHYCGLAS